MKAIDVIKNLGKISYFPIGMDVVSGRDVAAACAADGLQILSRGLVLKDEMQCLCVRPRKEFFDLINSLPPYNWLIKDPEIRYYVWMLE